MHGIRQQVSKKTYITWDEVESLCNVICDKIDKDNIHIERIVGISRGGLIPATLLAKCLGVREVHSFGVRSYPDDGYESRRHQPVIYQNVIHVGSNFLRDTKSTLIVDDVSDKGNTFKFVTGKIFNAKPKMIDLTWTASLFIKTDTTFKPNWYGKTNNEWIVFPWEAK